MMGPAAFFGLIIYTLVTQPTHYLNPSETMDMAAAAAVSEAATPEGGPLYPAVSRSQMFDEDTRFAPVRVVDILTPDPAAVHPRRQPVRAVQIVTEQGAEPAERDVAILGGGPESSVAPLAMAAGFAVIGPDDAPGALPLPLEQPQVQTGVVAVAQAGAGAALTAPTTIAAAPPLFRTAKPNAPRLDPAATVDPLRWASILADLVNLREAPTLEAETILQFSFGARVIILEEGPDWSLVQQLDRSPPVIGWVFNAFVTPDAP